MGQVPPAAVADWVIFKNTLISFDDADVNHCQAVFRLFHLAIGSAALSHLFLLLIGCWALHFVLIGCRGCRSHPHVIPPPPRSCWSALLRSDSDWLVMLSLIYIRPFPRLYWLNDFLLYRSFSSLVLRLKSRPAVFYLNPHWLPP